MLFETFVCRKLAEASSRGVRVDEPDLAGISAKHPSEG